LPVSFFPKIRQSEGESVVLEGSRTEKSSNFNWIALQTKIQRRFWSNCISEPKSGSEMPVDHAMVWGKRERQELADEGGSADSDVPSKRGRDGAGSKIVFECITCGQAFSQSSDLTAHMRIHTGNRSYTCTTCGQAFSTSGRLTRHMRCHTGDRLVCTTCGQAFSESGNLTTHMRTHSGDRPYTCTTCGQAFLRSGHLTHHMRTHSGDRPYACTTCGQAFSQSSNLKRHCAKVHALEHE
jgi:uncharacterized Zn-finger protein